jgi:mRNA interferase RelE/StbE
LKTFDLEFHVLALKEWEKLDGSIREQFKKALEKRVTNPHVISAKLNHDLANFYKIKLRTTGYRLVYEVVENRLVIFIIAVGKRDKEITYKKAIERKNNGL